MTAANGGPEAEVVPVPGPRSPVPTRVPAVRSYSLRDAEAGRAFLSGTPVRLTAPADGSVIASNRLFVGVRGEPGREVMLYDGDSLLRTMRIRGDGIADFIGVELSRGPHVLRVAMASSFGGLKWDSLAVHRTGTPARLVVERVPESLAVDAAAPAPVVVRLLDMWGVAVSDAPTITVETEGAVVDAADVDASSVGIQLRADAAGAVHVPLRGGARVGPASLALVAGPARETVSLAVLPTRRALVATGVGQLGVGAAPESFGAMTVRGAIGADAALSMTWDSRRAGDEREEQFARGSDPLDASRYPTYGDGSERRVEPGAGSQALSARLERGYDWVQAGDIATGDVAGSRRLGGYSRALTGVSARIGTGAFVWKGFGSLTEQAVKQVQLRGDGGSGPYILGADIRPGTERVAVEVRAVDNAARMLSRAEL